MLRPISSITLLHALPSEPPSKLCRQHFACRQHVAISTLPSARCHQHFACHSPFSISTFGPQHPHTHRSLRCCSPSPASRCCMPSPLPSAVTTRRAFMMAQHVAINTLPSTLFLPCTLCHEHMGRNTHTHTVALDVAAHLQHHAAACPPL